MKHSGACSSTCQCVGCTSGRDLVELCVEAAKKGSEKQPPKAVVLPVAGPEGLEFAYTFAAQHILGLPKELILAVSGLPQRAYSDIMNKCVRWILQTGYAAKAALRVEDAGLPMTVWLVPVVDTRLAENFAPRLFDYYLDGGLGPPDFVQVVVPDAQGLFPGDEGYLFLNQVVLHGGPGVNTQRVSVSSASTQVARVQAPFCGASEVTGTAKALSPAAYRGSSLISAVPTQVASFPAPSGAASEALPPVPGVPTRGASSVSTVRSLIAAFPAPSGATSEVASTGEAGVVEALLGQVQDVAIERCASQVSVSNVGSTGITTSYDFGAMQLVAGASAPAPKGFSALPKRIALDVHPDDTIGNIKTMIQESEGIPADRQNITMGYKGLADTCTFYDVGRSEILDQQQPMMVLTLHLCSRSNFECQSSALHTDR